MSRETEAIREAVRERYSGIALDSATSCCNTTCGCGKLPLDAHATSAALGYESVDCDEAPKMANLGLGCGNPLAIANLKPGETVLDLGSGGGLDAFIASRRVGDEGRVIGVDMTPEMVALARRNATDSGFDNVEFRLGEIEHLPVADASVDAIISNCVINLSPNKEQVFQEAYRVLKPGGRISLSDVVAIAEVPQALIDDLESISACIGGAERVEVVQMLLEKAGFIHIRMTLKENSEHIVHSWAPEQAIEQFIASYYIEAEKEHSNL